MGELTCKRLFISILVFNLNICGSYAQNKTLLQIFPVTTPERQGISSSILDSMFYFIKSTHQNIHHITIIRNNHTVIDADIYPYSSGYVHDLASVTKSFTSLLTGIAIDNGFIKDENEPVLKYFPEITGHHPLADSLTIKHLVTMTSGFDCSATGGEKALNDMRKSNDWVKFIFSLPMIAKPGSTFSYCSCNFYLLGEIIYRSTGLTPHAFAKKYLFEPLQIKDTRWISNDKGINHGWGDLFLYPYDMAKIGQLVLDKGKWQRKQIVSGQWINKSLQTISKLSDDKGYGFGWWSNDKLDYYEAAGRGRQTISVIPSKNMIVTFLGGEFDAGTIGSYIFKSIKSQDKLPPNEKGYATLKFALKKLSIHPLAKAVRVNNQLIQKLNKRMILFKENITEIDSLQFDFAPGNKSAVIFYKKEKKEKYYFTISRDSYLLNVDPTLHLPVALQAEFKNESVFVLHYNQLCRINNFYFRFTIDKNNVSTIVEETSNFLKTNIESSFGKKSK